MTDNVAILDGFTREVWGECSQFDGPFLIKPDTDLDDRFKAWDMDAQEYVFINGWLWTFEDAAPSGS
jgi:hypothetical protein